MKCIALTKEKIGFHISDQSELEDAYLRVSIRDWLWEQGVELAPNLNGKKKARPCFTVERQIPNDDRIFGRCGGTAVLCNDMKFHVITGEHDMWFIEDELKALCIAVYVLSNETDDEYRRLMDAYAKIMKHNTEGS